MFPPLPLERFSAPSYLAPGADGWTLVNNQDIPLHVSLKNHPRKDLVEFDPFQEKILRPGASIEFRAQVIATGEGTRVPFEFSARIQGSKEHFTVRAIAVPDVRSKPQGGDENAKPPAQVRLPQPKPKPEPQASGEDAGWCNLINHQLGWHNPDEEDTQAPYAGLMKMKTELQIRSGATKLVVVMMQNKELVPLDTLLKEGKMDLVAGLDVYNDVGVQQELLNILDGYNGRWLGVALAALSGAASAKPPSRAALQAHLFKPKDIIDGHAHTKVGAYGENQAFMADMRRHVLREAVALVLFLDRAKASLVGAMPSCLFKPESRHKSSAAVATAISELLLGDQSLAKRATLKLHYVQHWLDERPRRVDNLAVDLRDGVILAFLSKARAGVDVLERLHNKGGTYRTDNVRHVVNGLRTRGGLALTSGDVEALVDGVPKGSRKQTLALVWRIFTRFSLGQTVSADVVRAEVQKLAVRHRNDEDFLGIVRALPTEVAIKAGLCDDPALAALLLQWAQVCAAAGGERVEGFKDLCDGKALCLAVGQYHPELLAGLAPGWAALRMACDSLGDLPLSLGRAADEQAEQAALGFTALLCSRLTATSKEARAARAIQALWLGRKGGERATGARLRVAKARLNARLASQLPEVLAPPRPRVEPRPDERARKEQMRAAKQAAERAAQAEEEERRMERRAEAERKEAEAAERRQREARALEEQRAQRRAAHEAELAAKRREVDARSAAEAEARREVDARSAAEAEARSAADEVGRTAARAAAADGVQAAQLLRAEAEERAERLRAAEAQRAAEAARAAEAQRQLEATQSAIAELARQRREANEAKERLEAERRVAHEERLEAERRAAREERLEAERRAAREEQKLRLEAERRREEASASAQQRKEREALQQQQQHKEQEAMQQRAAAKMRQQEEAEARRMEARLVQQAVEQGKEDLARTARQLEQRMVEQQQQQRLAQEERLLQEQQRLAQERQRQEQGQRFAVNTAGASGAALGKDKLSKMDRTALAREMQPLLSAGLSLGAATALLELVSREHEARAALDVDAVVRLIRRCSRADGQVLIALLRVLDVCVPKGLKDGPVAAVAIDVMQTFYDREDEFKAAVCVLLKCDLSKTSTQRLRTLAGLLQVKCRAGELLQTEADSKVARNNLRGLEWWWKQAVV